MLTSFTDCTHDYSERYVGQWRWSGALLVGGLP